MTGWSSPAWPDDHLPQSWRVAMRAPSERLCSFAQTMLGCTSGTARGVDAKPQSTHRQHVRQGPQESPPAVVLLDRCGAGGALVHLNRPWILVAGRWVERHDLVPVMSRSRSKVADVIRQPSPSRSSSAAARPRARPSSFAARASAPADPTPLPNPSTRGPLS